jgi:adenylate cyclase
MAQRMESVAPPGGVVLSESTARLVETTATLGEPEMVRIKGSDLPVAARRLVAAGSNTHPPARQLSTLVGRDWELATVAGMLAQSMKGKGRIVGLVGPPGIGKSRLAAEISFLAGADGIQVFTAACESHTSDLPFHVATRLLRETLAIGTEGGQEARAGVRARMVGVDPEDLVLLEDLLGIRDEQTMLPAIDADARGRRLSAMLNAAVVARKTPAVYVIEDVHWIDEVSEAMIAEFAGVVPQTCALLLLTSSRVPRRTGPPAELAPRGAGDAR